MPVVHAELEGSLGVCVLGGGASEPLKRLVVAATHRQQRRHVVLCAPEARRRALAQPSLSLVETTRALAVGAALAMAGVVLVS